ncbi:zf-HC2 domain-containing protein [Kitasatospora sp. NPDC049258]|uniref:zf-HC2 domain-containing protein n=1 Tax=Kitasatospora sp. NPDC049258 TaxID=3155394 RepID=UPI00343121E0
MTSYQDEHLDVGAYVLGVLDPADRLRFEAHLAGCPRCAGEVGELGGLEPLLAELAEAGPVLEQPSDHLLGRLVDEVAAARRRSRTRRLVLVAAAAVLVVGGPAVTLAATAQDPKPAAVATQQFSATDPATGVSATVGVTGKKWGSQVSLALSNVAGPKQCDLIAVSRGGERQTVTSWSVPPAGYGSDAALQTSGGAALQPSEIDHFEVRTLDGQQLLVSVPTKI